jgi:hypothetical protein
MDNSGHGAVMCIWGIYTGLRASLDICPSDNPDDEKLKTALDEAINRINAFIVANSVPPITEATLEDQVNTQVLKTRTKAGSMSKDELTKKCATSDVGKMLDKLRSSPREQLKANVDDLLSVPRLPVINPCL